jgi:hypothetical protein
MELSKAYELVIADLKTSTSYAESAQETALAVLRGRLNELKNIWSMPKDKDN